MQRKKPGRVHVSVQDWACTQASATEMVKNIEIPKEFIVMRLCVNQISLFECLLYVFGFCSSLELSYVQR